MLASIVFTLQRAFDGGDLRDLTWGVAAVHIVFVLCLVTAFVLTAIAEVESDVAILFASITSIVVGGAHFAVHVVHEVLLYEPWPIYGRFSKLAWVALTMSLAFGIALTVFHGDHAAARPFAGAVSLVGAATAGFLGFAETQYYSQIVDGRRDPLSGNPVEDL